MGIDGLSDCIMIIYCVAACIAVALFTAGCLIYKNSKKQYRTHLFRRVQMPQPIKVHPFLSIPGKGSASNEYILLPAHAVRNMQQSDTSGTAIRLRVLKSQKDKEKTSTNARHTTAAEPIEECERIPQEDKLVMQIQQIVRENLQNPQFNVKKLSELLNMSQPTLYRRIKQRTNMTIVELIRNIRIDCAADLLKEQEHNVQEVAEMVGYNDIPTFRKHFILLYGTTPSAFKKDGANHKK